MSDYFNALDAEKLNSYIPVIMKQNWDNKRLDGWFLAKEIMMESLQKDNSGSPAMIQARLLEAVVEKLPLSIRDGEIFAGAEADAFARSYALINPDFKVESFEGYCDEDAVYNDIKPDGGAITEERISKVRNFWMQHEFAKTLKEIYKKTGDETREVIYFVERVTGHTIPDFRDGIALGIDALITELDAKKAADAAHTDYYSAMQITLRASVKLAERYCAMAHDMAAAESDPARVAELNLIAETCSRVPRLPARNLYEAIQSFIILWQTMNLEQLPNPFAFSIGNLDRILQPYLEKGGEPRDIAVALTRHLLAFFCVGDRNWAISQNIMAGGMDENGNDLTCEMTYVVIEAFEKSNYSQPNLSVKAHPGTPDSVYKAISQSMFSFGHSTPSFFSDPSVFKALATKNIAIEDMPLYAAAGCQEPLIIGKESANTTNSWLNLAKILELALNDGKSLISGKQIGPKREELGLNGASFSSPEGIKAAFYKYLEYFIAKMVWAANGCTEALALIPAPFHSAFMGGRESGADMRDVREQGMKYNGSGCLIHGLGTVADSFLAIDFLFKEGAAFGFEPAKLADALRVNYEGYDELRDFLRSKTPKYGNNDPAADAEALELQERVSRLVNAQKNPLGNPFCADWSTPSTNMLYGYWTGATPNGRLAREILSYGLDPEVASGRNGLLARIASQAKLNYALMSGGSAVALSINPDPLQSKSLDEKAKYLKDVISAVFGYNSPDGPTLMYAYFNVFSPEKLLDVLKNPENYPEPVLVRIHGQYGDARHLSADIISGDVIPRLDPMSTSF
ncbi:MAG: pyruvate formate lyase family protein [bacterium]